ncbi:MAG: quinolinate synthase NadA [Spirochaetes bacterium]|nr:quinolinate synthase NadA [Spirochaetota bacterium]
MDNLQELSDTEVDEKILKLKNEFKEDLFIPVHHYQRDEIVQFADYTGDSLELSRVSAKTEAKFIVFCGVYFMAEIARVLADERKYVFIPNRGAGCPLADFAFPEDIENVWNILNRLHPHEYIPVTYANSHAAVKAFCGRNEGLICTSSNVAKIFKYILESGKRVFFMPDKNLGINTASSLGMGNDLCVVDGYSHENLNEKKDSRLVIWNGFCIVHRVFTPDHVKYWRKKDSGFKIIVHPECEPEVVEASDYSGSTSRIKKMIEGSPAGSKWVIGTEYNLVNRLSLQNKDKMIEPLDKSVCANMSKNRRRDLLSTLLAVQRGDYTGQVLLSREVIRDAKKAIERMLDLS